MRAAGMAGRRTTAVAGSDPNSRHRRWSSVDAFADLVDGLLQDKGMPSPVLWPRSLRTALMRDLSHGPVTTRRAP